MGNNNGTSIPKVQLPSPIHDLKQGQVNLEFSTPLASVDYFQRKKRYSEIKTKSVCSFCSNESDRRSLKTYKTTNSREFDEKGNIFNEIRQRFRFKSSRGIHKTESHDFSGDIRTRSIISSTPHSYDCEFMGNLSRSAIEIQPKNNECNDTLNYYDENPGEVHAKHGAKGKKSSLKKMLPSNFQCAHKFDFTLGNFKSLSLTENETYHPMNDMNGEIFNLLSTPKKRPMSYANQKPILEKISEASPHRLLFTGFRSKQKSKKSNQKTTSYEEGCSSFDGNPATTNLRKSISCNTLKNAENSGKTHDHHLMMVHQEKSRKSNLKKSITPSPQEIFEKNIPQLSSSEVLKCLANFIKTNCPSLFANTPSSDNHSNNKYHHMLVASWIKGIDKSLLVQGWSEIPFITPVNITFLFMLLKSYMKETIIKSHAILHSMIMACLYLSYAYMGNEISYPLKPFITAEMNFHQASRANAKLQDRRNERSQSASTTTTTTSYSSNNHRNNNTSSNINKSDRDSYDPRNENTNNIDVERDKFWLKCLTIMNEKSSMMLKINADIEYFMSHFFELCQYSNHHQTTTTGTIIRDPSSKLTPISIVSCCPSPQIRNTTCNKHCTDHHNHHCCSTTREQHKNRTSLTTSNLYYNYNED